MMDYISNFFQASNWEVFTQGWASFFMILIVAWSLIWKGIALWKSSRLGQKVWFIIMLIVNTIGILEIIYIFAVARKKTSPRLVRLGRRKNGNANANVKKKLLS